MYGSEYLVSGLSCSSIQKHFKAVGLWFSAFRAEFNQQNLSKLVNLEQWSMVDIWAYYKQPITFQNSVSSYCNLYNVF